MKPRIIGWIIFGVLLAAIFVLTFMKAPEAIVKMLEGVSRDVRGYSAFIHALFLGVVGLGLFMKKSRDTVFSLFLAFLSLSATVVSIKYAIVPNIIIFTMFFVLIIHAHFTKKLNFSLKNIPFPDLLFGIVALVFGFWYLHWVESPIGLNALLFSPLGSVNCPTMVTICGFLSLSRKPRSMFLDAAVSLITLYFGFFGLFRLGAYVDVALIVCSLFLIVRLGSYLNDDRASGGLKERVSQDLGLKNGSIK
jgi:hypothetical protein